MKRWQQCFQELCVIFVVPWQTANISSYIEWTRANVGISLTFLQLTCVFCCKYICRFKLKFLLKNCLRGMKMKYILCERAWSQCIMGNRKIAENVLKNYWYGIFFVMLSFLLVFRVTWNTYCIFLKKFDFRPVLHLCTSELCYWSYGTFCHGFTCIFPSALNV